MTTTSPSVAIVDYGMGNLFSVQAACEASGLQAVITSAPDDLNTAAGVILPGIGAFGEAMIRLREQGLDGAIREFVSGGRPFMGICLGLQLLFDSSEEFGSSEGLGILAGRVVGFPRDGRVGKVPSVGWNAIRLSEAAASGWTVPPLSGVANGETFYFVHSYFVEPEDPSVALTTTTYGGVEYVSSVSRGNVFACQFHPERSGPAGLRIYQNFSDSVRRHG